MLAIYIVLALMIIGAIISVECRDLLSSVIAVGMVGLGLSLISLVLHAPDVAITQLVVEIFSVIILIRATIRQDLPESPVTRRPRTAIPAVVLCVVFVTFAARALRELPALGEPHMRVAQHYVEHGLEETGAANLVAAVLLDYRAYDTLGEATVLFTALIGVLAIVRAKGRRERHEVHHDES